MCRSTKENKYVNTENKGANNMEKSLNLSLIFHRSGGYGVSYDTINGNIIKTKLFPCTITIINDSLIIIVRQGSYRREYGEYRGKLTEEQYLEILKKKSALKQKYDYVHERGIWSCILEIDNQIYYKYIYCDFPYKFSKSGFPPMPEEIELLFEYIVGLSPIPIMLSDEPSPLPQRLKNYPESFQK